MKKSKSSQPPPEPKSKSNKKNPPTQQQPQGPVQISKDGSIRINVLAKPGAKESRITDVGVNAVGVALSAPPREGEANTELVRFMAEVLGLRKSDVTFVSGMKSRDKVVSIERMKSEDILRILEAKASED
ncbi:hypothetical protein HDU76_008605 [Blyttiomyces sp. JEL0837]|nr:hypothetical protein HDU76_008605 [Blyttiomyces sp. JEL0837]